ncbi:MAG: hypothetical protein LBH41_00010 [Rickettsiales bacterium]|jgi:hypothetical protein|nr:hypothetical protein [Rickettsiales bacterium]
MSKLLAILVLSACGAVRDYSDEELTLRYFAGIQGKSKNQIYVQAHRFFKGPAGLSAYSAHASKAEGGISATIEAEGDISPLHSRAVKMTMNMTISDGSAEFEFSNPRLVGGGFFVARKEPRLDMPEEVDGYRRIALDLVSRFKSYAEAAADNLAFENPSSYALETEER